MSKLSVVSNFWANSHHPKVVAFAIIGAILGAGITHIALMGLGQSAVNSNTLDRQVSEEIDKITQVADPVRLRVPSVGIDTSFAGPLGLNEDQTVEVPKEYDVVGWYQFGPKPGELGPAVVLGHVDSYEGPAVFWPLQKVRVGDVVEIERSDGSVGVFVVTDLEQHQQSGFPTTKVYGDIDHAGLRLITCSGTFDRGRQVYSHNLIVYAELVEDISSTTEATLPQ